MTELEKARAIAGSLLGTVLDAEDVVSADLGDAGFQSGTQDNVTFAVNFYATRNACFMLKCRLQGACSSTVTIATTGGFAGTERTTSTLPVDGFDLEVARLLQISGQTSDSLFTGTRQRTRLRVQGRHCHQPVSSGHAEIIY